jgi:hypothetical protein
MKMIFVFGLASVTAMLVGGCAANVDPASGGVGEATGSAKEAYAADGYTFSVAGPHGGSGGGQSYPLTCPSGEVLVGFHGHFGNVIDQLGLVCAYMNPDGSLQPELWYNGPLGGGSGGNPFWQTCLGNQYVAAMAYGTDDGVISRLMMYCADSAPGGKSQGWVFAAGPPYGSLVYDNCNQGGPGNAVVGFTVRSGTYIDSMQTECEYVNP